MSKIFFVCLKRERLCQICWYDCMIGLGLSSATLAPNVKAFKQLGQMCSCRAVPLPQFITNCSLIVLCPALLVCKNQCPDLQIAHCIFVCPACPEPLCVYDKCRMVAASVAFFFKHVLKRPYGLPSKLYPRKAFKLPNVMTTDEVWQLLTHTITI